MAEVEPDIESYDDLPETSDDGHDPVVLAYRLGGERRALVRVRRSEIAADPDLVEVGRPALSIGFDPTETLGREPEEPRPADPHIHRKIQFKLMAKEIRKRINAKDFSLKSLPDLQDLKSMNDPAAHYILTLVTDQLITEGLWRDEDKDLTMTEAFPLSQAKNETRIRHTTGDQIEETTFWQDSDLTSVELTEGSQKSPVATAPLYVTWFSVPMLHNLMRSSPRDLYHQTARRMIDSHYFEEHPELKSRFRSCYFISKGVDDEAHFSVLMKVGLKNIFPHYTFEQFRVERVVLRRHVRALIENYFSQNPAIQRQLKMGTSKHVDVWARFDKVWDNLTAKQKEALEYVYMDQDRLSKAAAAKKFGISVNSLISRLRTAVRRFRAEFPEFVGMSPKRLPRRALHRSIALNGLWRYQSAAWKSPLFAVDRVTGFKKEIEWRKIPRSKNLDWKTVAHIKAQIIENCPVPHIVDTEYFDGMKPTILSLGRRAERTPEDRDIDLDLDTGLCVP